MGAKSSLRAVTLAALALGSSAAYTLQERTDGSNFLDNFYFEDGPELNGGWVDYISENYALTNGLASVSASDGVRLGVDSSTVLQPNGPPRASTRVLSHNTWNKGLFVFDIQHMPGNACGIFPAMWTCGPNWPNNGEIDIIEQINLYTINQYTIHTATNANCYNDPNWPQLGSPGNPNCNQYVDGGSGCPITDMRSNSFGTGYNNNGGGVTAMEWTDNYIHFWFWPRGEVPSDATSDSPHPRSWGAPTANFALGCSIRDNFRDHQLIFNTNFCGDWVRNDWGSACRASTGVETCPEYVARNPSAFTEAYWQINSIKVFQGSDP